ncbi:hypothetical protein ACQBAT_05060 [Ornithinimicrobium sp. Y1847]|uniref:hypothetical protein n=1 Tax=Ornithinimicrobium sp. Y1847 TaxID=3405419 RepID=UPI003B6824E3
MPRTRRAARSSGRCCSSWGHPTLLADGFRGGGRALIGPAVYPAWLALLKLLLAIVPAIAGGVALTVTAADGGSAGEVALATLTSAIGAAVQVALWVTVAFAIVERVGVDPATFAPLTPGTDWDPADLPEPQSQQMGWGEAAWSIVAAGVGIALLTTVDYTVRVDGQPVQVLTDAALLWRWVVVAGLVLGVVVVCQVLVRGRWTMASAGANLLTNLLVGIPLVGLLLADRVVTPQAVGAILQGNALDWADLNLRLAGGVIAGILVWDTFDVFRKARPHTSG